MKYTIELTNKQKDTFECLLAITRRFIGFNPKLEPITSDVAGYMTTEELKELQKAEYDVGWHNGYKQGRVEEYNRGLEDAKEIFLDLSAIPHFDRGELFGNDIYQVIEMILRHFKMTYIAEKIKAYEEKKKAEEFRETFPFKLGDVVIHKEKPIMGIVIGAWQQEKRDDKWIDGVRIITRNTEILEFKVDEMYKAEGRHYDIESILKELGNEV